MGFAGVQVALELTRGDPAVECAPARSKSLGQRVDRDAPLEDGLWPSVSDSDVAEATTARLFGGVATCETRRARPPRARRVSAPLDKGEA
jgi:hypothetical protein